MRAAFLPLFAAALTAFSPVLAQDTAAATDAAATDVATDVASATDTATTATTTDSTTTSGEGVTPTEPDGNTLVKAGSNITAQWTVDQSGLWSNMTIELMTGSNEAMTSLETVGEGIDGTVETSYSFVAPQVHPYSKIYFLQFTNPGESGTFWTTRFTIASASGAYVNPTLNETTSAGEVVGYGDGALGEDTSATTTSGSASVESGVGSNGVTLYTAGITTGTSKPTNVDATGVAVATEGASAASMGKLVSPAAAIMAVVAAAAVIV